MPKIRLDVLLTQQGLAESRSKAQAMIMAGQIKVDGVLALKPGSAVAPECVVTVDRGPRFVSRGGEKLDAALDAFAIDVKGWTCADVGASTGGFTDCLVQRGAERVYAIDVGKGLLDWSLRNDPRVVVMEETNARFVEALPEPVRLVTIDAAFISLKVLLPVVRAWFPPCEPAGRPESDPGEKDVSGGVVALIKPQFEAGRAQVSRGSGVIRDPQIHRQVLSELLHFARGEGFSLQGLHRSPLLGPKGNAEFLAWFGFRTVGEQVETLIAQVLPE